MGDLHNTFFPINDTPLYTLYKVEITSDKLIIEGTKISPQGHLPSKHKQVVFPSQKLDFHPNN